MMKKLIALTTMLLLLAGGLVQAATYTYIGAAADATDWIDPANWSTDSASWTWPNDEFDNEYTNQDADQINVTGFNVTTANNSGGAGWLSLDGARDGSNTATMTLDNSTLTVTNGMWVADFPGTRGTLNVNNGSTLDITNSLQIGDDDGSVGEVNVSDSTVTVGGIVIVSDNPGSVGQLNLTNSTLTVGGNLHVAWEPNSNGSMTIENSTLSIGDKFYMNDAGGAGATSEVVMQSGVVTTVGNSYFNDDAGPSSATFTMHGGSWTSGGTVDVSWNLDGTSLMTVNDGDMTATTEIRLGVSGGGDTGQSRVFLNGGSLQGEDLEFNMTDSLIVFTGGELRVNSAALDVAGMLALVGDKIDVSGAPAWGVTTRGDYTVLLVPEPGSLALILLGCLALIARPRRRLV